MTQITDNINIDSPPTPSPVVITLCSGKGGVGKSVLSANIAYELSKSAKVLLWDTNIQFPNSHLIFGVEPPVRLNDVYEGNIDAETAIYKIQDNLFILSGSPAYLSENQFVDNKIVNTFEQIINQCDFEYILIDSQAGYSLDIFDCCSISDFVLLTVTDEPTSMLDAYGLMKILLRKIDISKFKLLINNVIDNEDADEIKHKFNLVTKKFLKMEIESIGFVPYNRIVRQSIIRQELFTQTDLDMDLTNSIKLLTNNLISDSETIKRAELV
jgi:flagellar biosynthesis protein FlhG